MRAFFYRAALLFAFCVAVALPFPWHLFSFQQHILPRLFGPALYRSDSAAQAILYVALAGTGVLIAFLLTRISTYRAERIQRWVRAFLLCYLAAVLARYGADKLLKIQFYLPEPTTLYTPFGQLEKDTLYWSVMGLSRPYSLFLGATEVLAALLLLFRTTRRAGLLLALTVFIQVLAVDLSFGIDVRMFSAFLLFLTMLLVAPDALRWRDFFLGRAVAAVGGPLRDETQGMNRPLRGETHMMRHLRETHMMRLYGIIIIIAVEALWPVWSGSAWNDDRAARPPLHGAYRVLAQEPAAGLPAAQRVLVHRAGYFVLQDSSNVLHPLPYIYDTASRSLQLQYSGRWNSYLLIPGSAGSWSLFRSGDNGHPAMRLQSLSWRALPAFH